MTDEKAPERALVKVSDRTLAPARSLASRTLAELGTSGDRALSVPRRLIVAADGSAMFETIGAAIAIALDGDEIIVEPGRYLEHLTINRSIRIRGHGPKERVQLFPRTAAAPCITIIAGAPHLAGFTIDGRALDYWGDGGDQLVLITGGGPTIEGLDLWGGQGVQFSGHSTRGLMRDCSVREILGPGNLGDGRLPALAERSSVWANALASITPSDDYSPPIIRDDGPYDGQNGAILIREGASPEIEDNDVVANGWAGILIAGSETSPIIRANRVHDGEWAGILVMDGASPRVIDNVVEGNTLSALGISGSATNPMIRANTFHGGYAPTSSYMERHGTPTVSIRRGASPRIEDNQIVGGGRDVALQIEDPSTDPVVLGNRIDGRGKPGVRVVGGSRPILENNEVRGDEGFGVGSTIEILGAQTRPLVEANRVYFGSGSGVLVRVGAEPVIRGNTFVDESGYGGTAIRVEDGAGPTIGPNLVSKGGRIRDLAQPL